MNAKEEVEIMRKSYQQSVKPYIESEDYMVAYFEMSNLLTLTEESARGIMTNVHCGQSFLASGRMLQKELEGGNQSKIEKIARMFETFSAQTTLPLGD